MFYPEKIFLYFNRECGNAGVLIKKYIIYECIRRNNQAKRIKA